MVIVVFIASSHSLHLFIVTMLMSLFCPTIIDECIKIKLCFTCMNLTSNFSSSYCSVHYNGPYGDMRRRLRVTQEALDELGAPAAMEPPCPTVSHDDVRIVGGV